MFIARSMKTNSVVPKFRQTDRQTDHLYLHFFSSMCKWDTKPDMLLVLATLHIQVLEMLSISMSGMWHCTAGYLAASVARQHSGVTIKGRKVPSILHHFVTSQQWEPNTCTAASYAIVTQPSSTALGKRTNSHTGNVVQYSTVRYSTVYYNTHTHTYEYYQYINIIWNIM